MPQNIITKTTIDSLGYGFIKDEFIPKGKDEYYLRNLQNRSGIEYRNLSAYEIEALVRNRNTSDDWNKIFVSDAFNPELVKNCKFYGLVRIGKLEPYCLGFSDLKSPVGLYNSTIISCDFGDNVVIDNVNYLSHYIIGNEVIIANVNELATTNHSKFGNGIVKDGEEESVRIWMEICNENGGRRVLPFNGMLPGDAYLWSKFRDDDKLLEQFKKFTELEFKLERGYYGKIGNRTVIKNSAIIKDVWIGDDAYIKGANKLKNLTINSGEKGKTQIGEGCELVNGIIGFGCTIFYGVKAVRFVMASQSQLKYGARLINSYLGNNATISCCEVLNSLIFPAHEQHHNNSFLCAALIMGQSNIAAGATIGSNHNSRGADGEIIVGRGFWPGLCVSLKHNSKFASFTLLAKGDYPAELNIPTPFSLVTLDLSKDQVVIMPAYWMMYNLYALARNSWKYIDRDKRVDQTQHIEYSFLAPDTVNEMFASLSLLEEFTGKAFYKNENKKATKEQCIAKGKELLNNNNPLVDELEITATGFENSKRKVVLIKVRKSYALYKQMIAYYATTQLIQFIQQNNFKSIADISKAIPTVKRNDWLNIGGQLMPVTTVTTLREKIKSNKLKSWTDVHKFYKTEGSKYPLEKLKHALASLNELSGINVKKLDAAMLSSFLQQTVSTKEWITKEIFTTREKDYTNHFRAMVYDTMEEMNKVVGRLEDNSFIKDQNEELKNFKEEITALKKKLKLK
jgi:NDP-sugar pyrophosphorylase family protein